MGRFLGIHLGLLFLTLAGVGCSSNVESQDECPAGQTFNPISGECKGRDNPLPDMASPLDSDGNNSGEADQGSNDDMGNTLENPCLMAASGTACDDGVACSGGDQCLEGTCTGREICCGDTTDNDGDGLDDCNDPDCDGDASCGTEICGNGVDDNGDNLKDCEDPACASRPACKVENCTNGRDDNGDGEVDCLDEDCAMTAGCGSCPYVPTPDLVSESPLMGETTPGRSETIAGREFTDDYVYNSADTYKVGTRREWGGTIVFFGAGLPAGKNNTNVIDANDTGREVQVAFYDPDRKAQSCAWNASCASSPSQCVKSITFLGWNPVQGGNRCNKGSGVENVSASDGVQTVQTLPLHWNPNWERQDCVGSVCSNSQLNMLRSDVRVFQRLRFVRENVVELDYTVHNLAAIDHRETAQEFPTIYTANGRNGPDLWRLFDSSGTEIAINTPANDGFFWKPFNSAGGWVSMQNSDLTYGVGHYTENRLGRWQGWQLRSLPFNNFQPEFRFGIPANGTVRARSYLILGGQATVAAEANWLDSNLAPFGVIDSPTADMKVSGSMVVRGWALDNRGVTSVAVKIDGGAPIALNRGIGRPDVCKVWPQYPQCGSVGYSGTVDVSGLSKCAHGIEVVATDANGNSRVISRRRIIVE